MWQLFAIHTTAQLLLKQWPVRPVSFKSPIGMKNKLAVKQYFVPCTENGH